MKKHKRVWLAPKANHETSFVIWNVEGGKKFDGNGHVSADLCISDCNRRCRLEFDFNGWSDSSYEERMDKLDALIHSILDFKAALELASGQVKKVKKSK